MARAPIIAVSGTGATGRLSRSASYLAWGVVIAAVGLILIGTLTPPTGAR